MCGTSRRQGRDCACLPRTRMDRRFGGRGGCQGRNESRPQGRSKSRPVDQGIVGGGAVWSGGLRRLKAARLGRSGRRPPPRGEFAAVGGGRQSRRVVGGSGV